MPCERIDLGNGQAAIVCTGRTKRCACGRRATLLCDWKVSGKKSGTCDKPLCASCTTSPAPGKDLCPAHVAEFERWQAARETAQVIA